MSHVLGNVPRLMTMHLYRLIESRVYWDCIFKLSDQEVIGELLFWKDQIYNLNMKCLSEYKVHTVVMYSDASSFDCNVFSCEIDDHIFHKMWTGDEKELSSTWR